MNPWDSLIDGAGLHTTRRPARIGRGVLEWGADFRGEGRTSFHAAKQLSVRGRTPTKIPGAATCTRPGIDGKQRVVGRLADG